MDNNRDIALVQKYLAGDEKSLEELLRLYLKPLYGFTHRSVHDRDVCEDLVQEISVKVWRHLRKFDQKKSFKNWIFTIAKNTIFDFLKKKKTISFSMFENADGKNMIFETIADSGQLPYEVLYQEAMTRSIGAGISQLSHEQRTIISLHYHHDLTFRQISVKLQKPLHTLKSRHFRALLFLRKFFGNSSGAPK